MPLFIFVSGFLAKRIYTDDNGLNAGKILSFLLLTLLFHFSISLLDYGFDNILGRMLDMRFVSADWYLVSLLTWYLLTPLMKKLRPGPAILIAISIGILAGYIPEIGKMFSLSRTLVFLPFFVLGYYCPKELLSKIHESKALIIAGVVATVFITIYWLSAGRIIKDIFPWVFGSKPYPDLSIRWAFYRTATYVIAITISLAIILITPKKKIGLLSYLGMNTLQIYVIHRLIRSILENVGMYDLAIVNDQVLGTPFLLLVTVLMLALCALPMFKKPFDWVLGIKWNWLINNSHDSKQG